MEKNTVLQLLSKQALSSMVRMNTGQEGRFMIKDFRNIKKFLKEKRMSYIL